MGNVFHRRAPRIDYRFIDDDDLIENAIEQNNTTINNKIDQSYSILKIQISEMNKNISKIGEKIDSLEKDMKQIKTELSEKRTIYDVLNKIDETHIEYFSNNHHCDISLFPNDVEKKIYYNCIMFLKNILMKDEDLINSIDNEMFLSCIDHKDDAKVVW